MYGDIFWFRAFVSDKPNSRNATGKPFFSNCFWFTLISIQSYSCCKVRTLEISFSIILYAQSFDKYNVIHAGTYLMEKKMIPLSELCIKFDITLIEQVENWSVCKMLSRSRHFSPSLPRGVRQQSELMQAKRPQVPKFEKLCWGTVLWTLVQRNRHQAN